MSEETSHLILKVTSDGYVTAENRFGSAAKSAEVFERALNKLEKQQQTAERVAQRAAEAVERAAARAAQAETRKAEAAERAAQRAAAAAERAYEKEFAALVRKEEKAAAAAARNSERQAQAIAREERAAAREAAIWNDQIQKAKARYDREAEAAERAAKRKAEAADMAARRDADSAARESERKLASVKKQLMTEEQLIRQSENERRRVILENTKITEAQRTELLALSAAKTKALLDRQAQRRSLGMDGVLPVRPSLERIEGQIGSAYSGAVGILGAIGVGALGSQLVSVTREFDKLNAGLITATGSAAGAEKAFGALQQFATETPFSLRQTTDAFVKLVNYGLNPSERSLRSYGNTASALGKDLGQMIEAVADAQTGEFERLKEFGIKASQQGDKVTFVFRGVKTEVEKNSKAIQDYLIRLGETNFADAMANRMKTLDGAISNLGDAWEKLVLTIGRGAVGDLIADAVKTATTALESFGNTLSSSSFIEGTKSFKQAVVGVASTIDELAVRATAYAKIAWSAAGHGNPIEGITKRATGIKEAREELQRELERINYATRSAMKDFDTEAANAKAVAEKRAKEAKETEDRLAGYDKSGGRSGFGKKANGAKGPQFHLMDTMEWLDQDERRERAQRMQAESEKLAEQQQREYEQVKASLTKEEDAQEASYKKRAQILQRYTTVEAAQYLLENESLWDKHNAAIAEKERKAQADKARVRAGLMPESQDPLAQLRKEEAQKLQIIEDTRLTDLEHTREYEAAKYAVQAEYARKAQELGLQITQQSAQNAESMFGSLAAASKNWGGEQSAIYRGMFAAQKAFAVASATTSMALGIGKAMELGWPAGIPAAIGAAAEGAKILAMISSANYSGAYDAGGDIPAGKVGLVGERGPEFVRGPATVTGRTETARMMSGGGFGSGGMPPIHLTVINAPEGRSNAYRASSAREQVVVSDTRRAKGAMQRVLGGR